MSKEEREARKVERDTRREERREERRAKKERVLHTRVPAVLETELKRLAASLRVPVSNVVRAILEDAIDTMDVATGAAQDELRSVAERLGATRRQPKKAEPKKAPLAGAIGVTEMKLIRDSECALTGETLASGTPAYMVHFDDGRAPMVVAPGALPASLTPA